jgi:hypothetical protein
MSDLWLLSCGSARDDPLACRRTAAPGCRRGADRGRLGYVYLPECVAG